MKDSNKKDLLILAALTLVICLLIAREITHWIGFYVNLAPGTDMNDYHRQALGILKGTWPGPHPFYKAPLYPYILAVFLYISSSLTFVVYCQIFFMVLSVLLLWASTAKEFGRGPAWLSALLFLFYGGAVFWITILHSTTMEIFFVSLTLYCLVGFRQQASLKRALCLGGVSSFLCLIRPNFLPIFILLLAGFWLEKIWMQKNKTFWKIWWVLALAFILPIFSVSFRNSLVAGKPMLFSSHGYTAFVYGNSEDSVVYNFITPKKPLRSLFSLAFWTHQGKRALAYWRSWEYPQNLNYYTFEEKSLTLKALFLNHGIIGALFFLSCFALAKNWKQHWPYFTIFWLYYFSFVFFMIAGRYRIPILPIMCFLIGGASKEIYQWIRERQLKPCLISALLFILVLLPMRPFEKIIRFSDRKNLFIVCVKKKKFLEARYQLKKSLELPLNKRGLPQILLYDIGIDALLGENFQALEKLEILRKRLPNVPSIWKTEVYILKQVGKSKEGKERQKEYEARFPATDPGYNVVEMLHEIMGQ